MESRHFSRPLATAARLGDFAPDRHLFTNKKVLLTGEVATLATANGRECFLAGLRLLVRICSKITVSLPSECHELRTEATRIAEHIAFGGPIRFIDCTSDSGAFDAILSVGTEARRDLPWTVINSNGWLARVSSGNTPLDARCDQKNPIGALGAASLGVGEVFKRLIGLKGGRGTLLDGFSFSLFSYGAGETNPGPILPQSLHADSLLLVGIGAIGNGIVHLLSQLPICGSVYVVDNQAFLIENLGTCLLIGPADLGVAKAEFASRILSPTVEARWYGEDFVSFREKLGKEIPYPKAVVGALDNIEARHQVQDLWPDLVIDGAIGDFGCQVSCHKWGPDVACLKCLFRQPLGEPAERGASRATGLSEERVRQPLQCVTTDDVRKAASDRQEWLGARVGVQICSVIQEAMAQQLSRERLPESFAPSVPFVACFSAAMVVGELVKSLSGLATLLEPRFQFDFLRGPGLGEFFPQSQRPDCVCVARRRNIELVRAKRFRAGEQYTTSPR
ncbi:MAG: ThiF family adenylyltransferase [Acidobacteria bacterium]|nr:ThiF family adenylyltransferase [Acidobacteriota bacterium]